MTTISEKELEKRVLKELSSSDAFEHIEWLCGNAPERLTGAPELVKFVEYLKETMKKYKVPLEVHEFDGFVSLPREAEMKIVSPEEKDIKCKIRLHSVSTPPNGIERELIDVGEGLEEDYDELDVNEKIVIALAHARGAMQAKLAELKGAVAIVLVQSPAVVEEMKGVIIQRSVKRFFGNPSPDSILKLINIPVISIASDDGRYLRDLCTKQTVRIWIKGDVFRGWKKIPEPVATFKGTNEPDKYILIGAHMDAIGGGGVTCNANGVALIMELARVFSKFSDQLRRTIKFAWWPCHETGPMIGSNWYVNNFWEDIRDNLIVYLNSDSKGKKGAAVWRFRNTAELRKFHEDTIRELGIEGMSINQMQIGDASSFLHRIGVPTLEVRKEYDRDPYEPSKAWWGHTEFDTIDRADINVLADELKTYAISVLRLCNSPILPMEFVSLALDFKTVLKNLQVEGKNNIDLTSLVKSTEEFESQAIELKENISKVMQKYQGLQKKEDESRFEKRFQKVNKCLMGTSKVLNQVYYGSLDKYYHHADYDSYKGPISILRQISQLGNLKPDGNEFKTLKVLLVQQRNKVSDALEQGKGLLKDANEELGELIKK